MSCSSFVGLLMSSVCTDFENVQFAFTYFPSNSMTTYVSNKWALQPKSKHVNIVQTAICCFNTNHYTSWILVIKGLHDIFPASSMVCQAHVHVFIDADSFRYRQSLQDMFNNSLQTLYGLVWGVKVQVF